jgi:NAD(P)-dependent dehydrogenase (short-subunit alcohol dehydrogenase family)
MPSILITGVTNGLGLVLAEELAEAGHRFASARSQPAVTGADRAMFQG